MTEPLHLLYRPKVFDEFFGSKEVVESIKETLGIVHCYLLYGVRGCGKTTLARIIAKELGADEYDIHEIDSATFRKIDEARKLQSTIYLKPMGGERKVYIFDEVHQLTKDAISSWLKTLEEPPEHVYFILCTTEVDKVLATIRSRAKAGEYRLKPLPRRTAFGLLDFICEKEEIELSQETKKRLVEVSQGVPREILGLVDKICSLEPEEAEELLKEGGAGSVEVKEFCKMLLEGNWKKIKKALFVLEEDPESVRLAVLGYMSGVVKGSEKDDRALFVMEPFLDNFYSSGRAGLIYAARSVCLKK